MWINSNESLQGLRCLRRGRSTCFLCNKRWLRDWESGGWTQYRSNHNKCTNPFLKTEGENPTCCSPWGTKTISRHISELACQQLGLGGGGLVETPYYPNNDCQTFKCHGNVIWGTERENDGGMLLTNQQISWPHTGFSFFSLGLQICTHL